MSTDYQRARAALGTRLRELRFSCPGGRLTGRQLAQRLGWPGSKVSKLETAKQTATPEDLRAWAEANERPDLYPELAARLAGFESQIRSWRRALANGFKPLHGGLSKEIERTSELWVWEESVVAGLMQTPEYARHVIQRYSELLGPANDIEDAVRARVQRQEWLYRSGRKLHVLMWEAALRSPGDRRVPRLQAGEESGFPCGGAGGAGSPPGDPVSARGAARVASRRWRVSELRDCRSAVA
ncbi:helix-turn-helix transcriptional regulator [Streptomyces sp. NBC_01549]|uniref:Scr1 family TA system antitoxin-like transcriptional regulator n=1 Tax=Streptomyces sp. NBC_01549 TaxID=2975874 RepID=UPI002257B455|nr:Scr1 family TA system antitoxin-like transcriptional regulator [Streptomyces sp. NBC_01549]MCX4588407.1 helix-turn-helix transcriptional regulator [Streptomyces sp. NBC_01549]